MYAMEEALKEYQLRLTQKQRDVIADDIMRIAFTPHLSKQAGVPVHGHLSDGNLLKICKMAVKNYSIKT